MVASIMLFEGATFPWRKRFRLPWGTTSLRKKGVLRRNLSQGSSS
jgi:hypothetical protein